MKCYNNVAFFYNFKITFQCEQYFHDISKEYKYGIVKYKTKKSRFNVVDKESLRFRSR